MKRYSQTEIQEIKELRKRKGYSFSELSRITGIPNTTIGSWLRNEASHNKWQTLIATNERKRNQLKLSEIKAIDSMGKISKSKAKVLLALLYWCEGSKYPASNALTFSNSDVDLMTTYVTLLKRAYSLNESKLSVHLQIHKHHNYEDLCKFWSKKLEIPIIKFIKPTITNAGGNKHRISYNGTCTVKYHDYRLLLKLTGIFEKFVKEINRLIS